MTIAKLTSDDLREPGRENTQLTKINEAIDAINDVQGAGTPGPGTFTTLSATGSVTLGDGAGDVLDVNGDLSKFGSTGGDGATYIKADTLNAGYGADSDVALYVNWSGYQALGARFRSLDIRDGKTAQVALFDGETKALTLKGPLDHDGASVGFYGTAPVAKQTGVAVTAEAIHAALVALGLIGA